MSLWRSRALALIDRCSRPAPPSKWIETADIDIDVGEIRVPSAIEVVDSLWEAKLIEENHDVAKAFKKVPRASISDTAYGMRSGVGPTDRSPSPSRKSVIPGKVGLLEPRGKRGRRMLLEKTDAGKEAVADSSLPPLPPIASVQSNLDDRCPANTGNLWRCMRARAAENCEVNFTQVNTISRKHFAYRNVVSSDPHGWWVDRLSSGPKQLSAMRKKIAKRTEVVVTVIVCDRDGRKEQEYDVLASQTLNDLRDAFYFVSDWMYDGITRIHSACFFIDGIFYTDTRHNSALDYSKELIEWVSEVKEPGFLRATKSRSMDTRICDLQRIPFGERCVYIHQGDLEHTVVFSNARFLHSHEDCPYPEAYPILTFMKRYDKRKCYACVQNFAIYIVIDSSRCPHNPSFWCQTCFRHFFQDEDGSYIQPLDYKVFPYLHEEQ